MKTSELINELAAALAKAQAEMKNAAMNRINPHFKSKYADLASVRDAVTPALAANGIALVQSMSATGDGQVLVHTRLMHSSGQWMESVLPIYSDVGKPQVLGSALSYARRYSLSAICNIASEDDDDANMAQEHGAHAAEVRGIAGTPNASKIKARQNGDFEMLVNELRKATTVDALKEWAALRKNDIERLPAEWVEHLQRDYTEHRDGLKANSLSPLDAG